MRKVSLLVIGDAAVGKTSLVKTFVDDLFPTEDIEPIFCGTRIVDINDDVPVCLDVYDAPSSEEQILTRIWHYELIDVFLLCFSLIDPNSFENIIHRWYPEISMYRANPPIILVGTKQDLCDDEVTLMKLRDTKQAAISTMQGLELGKNIHCVKYLECSAVNQKGLDVIFGDAVELALASKEEVCRENNCCSIT